MLEIISKKLFLYLDAIELTAIGLNYLCDFSLSRRDIKKNFLNMLKELNTIVFEVDPIFMSFIKTILNMEPLYNNGEEYNPMDASSVRDLNNIIEDYDIKAHSKKEDLGEYFLTTINVKLTRPRWRDPRLDETNHLRSPNSETISEKIFKILQLETFNGHTNDSEIINFSSVVQEFLSQESICYPFEWTEGGIRKKNFDIDIIEKELEEKLFVINAKKLNYCFSYKDDDISIISGLKIQLDKKEYFICQPQKIVRSQELLMKNIS